MEMLCVSIPGKRMVMLNRFCRKPLYEVTRTLANVAAGCVLWPTERFWRWFSCRSRG